MDTSIVQDLLQGVADSPQPPSTVDINRARLSGRRRVTLRRVASGGSAALAIVAVFGVVVVGTSGGSTVGLPQPGHPSAGSPTASRLPVTAPRSFQPLIQYTDFGWLPENMTNRAIQTEPNLLIVDASVPVAPAPTGSPSDSKEPAWIRLSVVTMGHTIVPANGAIAVGKGGMRIEPYTDAAPVNGAPARWADPQWGTVLQWQYAPGAWAQVTVSVPGADDPKELARKVAQAVQYGVDEPIRLPITPTGLPGSLRLMAVSVSRTSDGNHDYWTAQVSYSTTGERTQLGDWPLTILAAKSNLRTGNGSVLGNPDTTLDGHPARRSTSPDGGTNLQVFDVDGVYLELATHSRATTTLLGGGLDKVYRGLQIYRTPASWR